MILPKSEKKKKYQRNEERSNCIEYFIWGSGPHEDCPRNLVDTPVLQSAHSQEQNQLEHFFSLPCFIFVNSTYHSLLVLII